MRMKSLYGTDAQTKKGREIKPWKLKCFYHIFYSFSASVSFSFYFLSNSNIPTGEVNEIESICCTLSAQKLGFRLNYIKSFMGHFTETTQTLWAAGRTAGMLLHLWMGPFETGINSIILMSSTFLLKPLNSPYLKSYILKLFPYASACRVAWRWG